MSLLSILQFEIIVQVTVRDSRGAKVVGTQSGESHLIHSKKQRETLACMALCLLACAQLDFSTPSSELLELEHIFSAKMGRLCVGISWTSPCSMSHVDVLDNVVALSVWGEQPAVAARVVWEFLPTRPHCPTTQLDVTQC